MGGRRCLLDVEKMKSVILEIDEANSFNTMSALQTAVANSEYGLEVDISVANVYNFIKKHNLQLKTKKGERGMSKGLEAARANGVVRVSRATKWKNDPNAQEWLKDMRNEIIGYCKDINPSNGKYKVDRIKFDRANRLLNKAESGSVKALVALNCIACTAFDTSEIRHCGCTSCPFYFIRPYKSTDNEYAEIEIDDVPTGDNQ